MVRPPVPRLGSRVSGVSLAVGLGLGLSVILTACGGVAEPAPPPTALPPAASTTAAAPAPPTVPPAAAPCFDGRLLLSDLLTLEQEWRDGVAAAEELARQWQSDARLVQLHVGCQPLAAEYRWQGTFYSDSAQSYFASDTGQAEPAEDDPSTIPTLPTAELSFQQLHLALARSGQADTDTFNPASGVTIRLNTPAAPFGPPGIPEAVVYYVAVDLPDETRDLFVSAADWSIYSYRVGG